MARLWRARGFPFSTSSLECRIHGKSFLAHFRARSPESDRPESLNFAEDFVDPLHDDSKMDLTEWEAQAGGCGRELGLLYWGRVCRTFLYRGSEIFKEAPNTLAAS
jgi:hypothetical protein